MAWNRVYRLLDNIISLDENQIINEILSDKGVQEFIIDLNTQGQLFEKGIDSLGVSLGDYAPTTIEGTVNFEGKKEKGQRFDHITLNDTGEFYRSFKIVLSDKSFRIVADGQKDDVNLLDEFRDILGLTDENLQLVIDAIRKKIIPIIKTKIRS
jgi:hypothetical protein